VSSNQESSLLYFHYIDSNLCFRQSEENLGASPQLEYWPARHPAGGFRDCKQSVTAGRKPIAGKRENGFDRFPPFRFISWDTPTYSQNICNKIEVKTN